LSRQSRRSPNRISCYTASRSPLPSPYRLALQISCFRVSSPTSASARSISLDSIHGLATDTYTLANLRSARSVFRTFPSRPSTPVLAISPRHFGILPRLRVRSHRGFPSIPTHSFGSLRAIVPLFAASLGPWDCSHSLPNAPSSSHHSPQQASQFLYLARSLHRPTIAPLARSPFLRLRALLGFRSHRSWGHYHHRAPLPPPVHPTTTTSVPRPNSHAPQPLYASSLDR